MTEPLFLTVPAPMSKQAMEARLSDQANEWPQEIMQEALKQHPYLGQYDVSPVMREVEDERGYGLGYLVVRNKTSRLNTPAGQMLAAEAGVRLVKIPIIIHEQRVKDIDVFIDPRGRMFPLNEARLREAIFRPNLFDSYGMPDENATLIGDRMIPPDRSERMISGRGVTVDQGEVKTGGVRPLLMEAIASTILRSDIDRVESVLNDDQLLAHALITKQATAPFIGMLAALDPVSPADVVKTGAALQRPDTVHVSRVGDDYFVKVASSQFYDPVVYKMDRIKAASVVGEDVVAHTDELGDTVVSTDPVVKSDLTADDSAENIDRFGEYKVLDHEEREYLGWVFPRVIDFNGLSLPLKVFTNGSVSSIQSDIAGTFVGNSTKIVSSDRLEGDGFFFLLTEDGSAIAFIPGTITTAFQDEDGPGVNFETILGGSAVLRIVPGLKKLHRIDDNEFGLPENVQWSPMGDAVPLVEDPSAFVKTSSLSPDVSIVSDGLLWSFAGPAVEKLAASQCRFLEADDAMFLASALGMEPNYAMRKLAEAGQRGSTQVFGCRTIRPMADRVDEASQFAKTAIAGLPRKYVLLKEAAGLDDINTVDKVLSLGFLTPENVATFIEYIPDFEEAISKLAYILIAARLGLPDVPEVSVKNAMDRLEETTTALKELIYRKA